MDCPRCKKHGRDYVYLYKNEQKGFRPGGILSVYTGEQMLSLQTGPAVYIYMYEIYTTKYWSILQ